MGQIITFAQQKGGAGKTTLLTHLAHSWVKAGKSVALIDLDPQQSLSFWASLGDVGADLIETKDYRAGGDMRAAAKTHDYVLVDCPGTASSMLEGALRDSDLLVAPCQPTPLDAWATGKILDMAAKAKTPARVVMNRVPPRGTATEETIAGLRKSGAEVLKSRLGNRVAFAKGMSNGTTALGLAAKSVATEEIRMLKLELDRVLKKLAQ